MQYSISISEVAWAVKHTGLTEAQLRKCKGRISDSIVTNGVKKGAAAGLEKRKLVKHKLAKRKPAPKEKPKAHGKAEPSGKPKAHGKAEPLGNGEGNAPQPRSRLKLKLKPRSASRLRTMLGLRSASSPSTEKVLFVSTSTI